MYVNRAQNHIPTDLVTSCKQTDRLDADHVIIVLLSAQVYVYSSFSFQKFTARMINDQSVTCRLFAGQ